MSTLKAIEARLGVADVKRSAAFYQNILGFSIGTLWPEQHPEFAILHRDGLRLQLGMRDAPKATSGDGCTLCLDVDGALEMHAAISRHIAIEWGPEVYFYHRREFAFRDPDGHMIIVSEVTDDPVTCQDSGD